MDQEPQNDGYLAEKANADVIQFERLDEIDTMLVALKSQVVSVHNASCKDGLRLDEQIAASDAICRLTATYFRLLTI